MKTIAGSGTLITRAGQVPVTYDLKESSSKTYTAEGTVYGASGSLRPVYLAGPCKLRLETGRVTEVVLLDCNAHGVADIGAMGPIDWPV